MNLDTMLHWGEFAAVSAAMEHRGVPIDMEIASLLLDKHAWAFVRDAIVPRINAQYGVYVQDAAGEWRGSPYIGFAKRFDEAPSDATKKSHPHIHERYKVGCLGAQYSMQHVTLAQRLGVSTFAAHEMLSQHRGLFSKYWAWVEDWIAHALNTGVMHTRMGWTCRTGITEFNARSIGNWPVQATGADILRIACIEGHRRGLQLCGSVHDAILIESSLEQIDADVALMREIMRRASRIVLGDHELRTGVDIVRYPDSFYDSRGVEMWSEVLRLLEQYQNLKTGTGRAASNV